MAKQKKGITKVTLSTNDLFIRETPHEVIKSSLKLRTKACGLTVRDFSRAFTI
jgi:hypothetical protein